MNYVLYLFKVGQNAERLLTLLTKLQGCYTWY